MDNECTSINVREIVRKHIQSLGADGLFNTDVPCGCGLNDLFPCEGNGMDCVPARGRVLGKDENVVGCEPGEMCYFPISPTSSGGELTEAEKDRIMEETAMSYIRGEAESHFRSMSSEVKGGE